MVDKMKPAEGCLYPELLLERYRCPEKQVNFVLCGDSLSPEGYFKFGDGVICFGRMSTNGTRSTPHEALCDALGQVIIEDSTVILPFDPAEVIANLRSERYQKGKGNKSWLGTELFRSAYYALRPLMPFSVRKRLQRVYFREWQQIRFPEWPVDVTVESVQETLLRLALQARGGRPIPFIWFWPNGAPSCTILTHDVETQSGVDFCSRLMDVDDSYGIKSSFQIVPSGRYRVREGFLKEIRERNFELNVHDLNHDGHLFRDKAEFLRRAARINEYRESFRASGFRSAIMNRNVEWMGALDFAYDMSVPNVSHLDPQRGGCCTVLPYFIGEMVELPVTMTQDYTLFHILGDYSTDIWLRQSDRIRQKNGLLNAIVHPDYVTTAQAMRVYRGLLSHLAELRSAAETWIALPKDVAAWWQQRSRLTLVQVDGSWRIEGEGHERARLAYAVLEGDSLRYEVSRPLAGAETGTIGMAPRVL